MYTVKLSGYITAVLTLLLTACSSSGPARRIDPELSQAAASARMAYDRGEFKLAARHYRLALQRARVMDDAGEIGNGAYNLAACCLEEGDLDRAEDLLGEARRAFLQAGGIPTDLPLLQARVALLQGRPEEAESLLREEVCVDQGSLTPAVRLQAAFLRTRLAILADDDQAAASELVAARQLLEETEDDLAAAEYAALEGDILLREGSASEAGAAFDRQAGLLRRSARYAAMAGALARAGDAYRRAGDYCSAGDRFFRSARNLFARGDITASLEMITSAVETGEQCEQEAFREDVRGLFEEIRKVVPAPPDSETPVNEQ
ncbi:MAG: hypothetical protein V1789_11120 [PVC group bacterium]